jgi:hypothetical protein
MKQKKKIRHVTPGDICYRVYDNGQLRILTCSGNKFLGNINTIDMCRLDFMFNGSDIRINVDAAAESEYIADSVGYIFLDKEDVRTHLAEMRETLKETEKQLNELNT